ncbi:MAG: mandelate racemase/muconate lactonizing enzyme family protein [Armatimonadota bacterium]
MPAYPRIRRVTTYEVVVPAHPGAVNSEEYGNFLEYPWDLWPICLVEAEIDDGIVALGEVGRGHTLQELHPWLEQLPGLELRGLNLGTLPEGWRGTSLWGGAIQEAHRPPLWSSPTPLIHAVEMLLFDWCGKRLGCRVADLLGGAYRERVPVDYWCGRKTPADLRTTIERARERGFHGLKMKSRLGDPVVEQVAAIREVGGETFSVTIDPMYQWHGPSESLATLRALERFGAGVRVEDPFPEDRPEFWRRARQTCSVPLVWHARGLPSLRRALQEGCADAFNCSGVATEFLTYAHAVEVAGYSCWRGSSLELGVGQAAGLHAAAAARACTMPSDFQSALIREHTLVTWDWPYRDGTLPLPDAPGLGVELDHDAVHHYLRAQCEYTA